ncbi:MAG: hypothetical protein KF825_04315 [Ferruginibacter sp.]|nr:hypothetical protein [Ferruginibacter sp.]
MKAIFSVILTLFIFNFSIAQKIAVRKIPQPVASSTGSNAFSVYNSSELPIVAQYSKESVVVFDKENYDDANAFNAVSFKAPSSGIYQFTMQLGLKAKNTSSSISQVMLQIKSNSQSSTQLINIPAAYDNVITAQTNALFKLKAGDEVSVVMINLGSATAVTTGNLSVFSGIKIN